MKKFVILFLIIALLFTACTNIEDVLVIGERFFVAEITEIYLNSDDYLGRVIQYKGLFRTAYWETRGIYFHYVSRRTYGCCGDDGIVGFEVYLDGVEPFPDNTWVEVIGVLEEFELSGGSYLRLVVTSIRELTERGAEFVYA